MRCGAKTARRPQRFQNPTVYRLNLGAAANSGFKRDFPKIEPLSQKVDTTVTMSNHCFCNKKKIVLFTIITNNVLIL